MTETEQTLTCQENFDAMRTHLVGMGAGNRAVAGTVVNGETGGVFNTMYLVDDQQEPPVIAQFSITERGQGLASLTRVAVNTENQPMVAQSRHNVAPSADPTRILEALMHETRVGVGISPVRTDKKAPLVFDVIYSNAMAFEPNS